MANDDLDEIHEELVADQVYVHPSLRSHVSEAEEEALQQQVAEAEHPTYIVVWPFRDGDTYGGKPSDLLTRLQDAHPQPGIYLANTQYLEATDYMGVRVEGRQWDIAGEPNGDLDNYEVKSVVDMEKHPDLPSALGRTVELLSMDPDELNEIYDELATARSEAYRRENPPEEEDGWLPGGMLTVAVAAVAVFVAWRVAVSFRRKPAPLPKSAMKNIRAAQSRELLARARAESEALGERLDNNEIAPGDHTVSWQAALDHYAAVRRLLTDDEPDQLDVVGALVLAQRGGHALTAAQSGKAWQPAATCYLNPLHGRAERGQRLEWNGRNLDVPVCTECRNALRKKRTPDILDVVRRGKPQHYFETDVEPWASTGYGALEPDLLGAWVARRK